ncbi:hypothetical protein F7725_015143, partial [Dissostichus mawsoni]
MNIVGAWRRGFSGKGVVVSVLDDGIEGEHPDLKPNYIFAGAAFGPKVSERIGSDSKRLIHLSVQRTAMGLRVQGRSLQLLTTHTAPSEFLSTLASAVRASDDMKQERTRTSGGIRMLDGDVTDMVEAQSLSFRPHQLGPEDDGATLEGPGPLTRLALENGVKNGRRGRGSVFVWSSGSGGLRGDHCSCDGYSSSIYTVTLGPQKSCSRTTADSSLSSSVGAGVIALTLQANPLLTWRDVQTLFVRTSKSHRLPDPDWSVNGAGFRVSHLYGFGLLDAEAMVLEAQRWRRVPAQRRCVQEDRQISRYRTVAPRD